MKSIAYRKVLCIGQAPARPGAKHGEAGAYMRPWLYQIGLRDDDIDRYCRFYALTASFPGSGLHGHLRPTPAQILEHRPVLVDAIQDFVPDIIVLVGGMAIREVLPTVGGTLSDIIGNVYMVDPFDSLGKPVVAIPLPHPSGRSTWLHSHGDMLDMALQKLQTHMRI